jgi:hypothetical protein
LALFLVALCDFHLTFYVVLAGCVLGVVMFFRLRRKGFVGVKRYAIPLGIFVVLTLATTGVLAFQLLKLNSDDPLQQNHDPAVWSTDLVDTFIPGAQWRFNEMTRGVWGVLATPDTGFVYVEHSLYIGWVVLGLCGWLIVRRGAGLNDWRYWLGLMGLFFLLSLGPWIHVHKTVTWVPAVYRVLEWIFPPLKMGGVPMRLMVMVFLASAVIAGAGLAEVMRVCGKWGWAAALGLVVVWGFESFPKAQPITSATYPQWVRTLHDLPDGAVIDTTYKTDMSLQLYYATGHGKPVGEGYISRYPKSVEEKRGQFRRLVDDEEWERLRKEWGFKYLVSGHPVPGLKQMAEDGEIRVYELGD